MWRSWGLGAGAGAATLGSASPFRCSFGSKRGALCATPIPDEELGERECAAKSFSSDEGGTLTTTTEDDQTVGLDIPGQDPNLNIPDFTVVLEECLDINDVPTDLDIDIPTFGGCLDINAFDLNGDPIELGPDDQATVFICIENSDLGTLTDGQDHLIRVHRDDGTKVEALPLVDDACPEPVALIGTNPATRLVFGRAPCHPGWRHGVVRSPAVEGQLHRVHRHTERWTYKSVQPFPVGVAVEDGEGSGD